MIRRRDVPLAAAAQGLAIWSGSAFAQTKRADKKETATAPAPVHADERVSRILAPIRDEHHFPGLIGAVLKGDHLAAIRPLAIRKIASTQPRPAPTPVLSLSCSHAPTPPSPHHP